MPIASVRQLDPSGDMQWGRGRRNFVTDVPEVVAQRAGTRMRLWTADWFLNLGEGTPYRTAVLGKRTEATRDPALRARILGTLGCTGLTAYASQIDRGARGYSVQATASTIFGVTPIVATTTPNGDVRLVR